MVPIQLYKVCWNKCSVARRRVYIFSMTLSKDTCTVHSKCINDQTLRSDIFLPKCPTNLRVNTFWSDVRVDIKRFFFYISRGEYVKHFVIDAYL